MVGNILENTANEIYADIEKDFGDLSEFERVKTRINTINHPIVLRIQYIFNLRSDNINTNNAVLLNYYQFGFLNQDEIIALK